MSLFKATSYSDSLEGLKHSMLVFILIKKFVWYFQQESAELKEVSDPLFELPDSSGSLVVPYQ